jgi:hypothetical protein
MVLFFYAFILAHIGMNADKKNTKKSWNIRNKEEMCKQKMNFA